MMAQVSCSAICFLLGLVLPCTTRSFMPVSGVVGWVVPPAYIGGRHQLKEQCDHPAVSRAASVEFPDRGNGEQRGAAGLVHAPFFAHGSLSTPLNKVEWT